MLHAPSTTRDTLLLTEKAASPLRRRRLPLTVFMSPADRYFPSLPHFPVLWGKAAFDEKNVFSPYTRRRFIVC